ncbi:MAG: beta-ketoacyl synthase chain length factor [Myxococcales bacterium]|nr:beta-ketoacyl synthase chain length factor [Myxococcales bacterium]
MTTVGPVQLLGASLFSTHHASALDALEGRERAFTAPTFPLLVARARRFTSLVTQMHIEVIGALPGATEAASAVFATCHGEIQTAETLIADLRDAQLVSSARFALSVHNSPSGVYSVATGNTAPTTTITGDNAVAASWLEAVLTVLDTGRPVLLSIADEPVPAVFHGPANPVGVAAAFLLGPSAREGHHAELAITRGANPPDRDPDRGDDRDPALGFDLVRVLASAASGRSVALGAIEPGAALELQFLAAGART